MVRRKQSFSEFVQLLLYGPKSIMNEPVVVSAPLTRSWYELLSTEVGLEVTQDSGIFICTSNYTPSDPKNGVGWRSELNDTVGQFVNNYERQKKQYRVRLCQPENMSRSGRRYSAGAHQQLSEGRTFTSRATSDNGANAAQNISTNSTSAVPPTTSTPGHLAMPRASAGPSSSNRNVYNSIAPGIPLTSSSKRKQPSSHAKQAISSRGQTISEITLNVGSSRQNAVSRLMNGESQQKRPRIEPLSRAATTSQHGTNAAHRMNSDPVDAEWENFWGNLNGSSHQQRQRSQSDKTVGERDSGNDADFHDDSDDDNASLCTAVTVEENELRKEGIQVEDVKSFVDGRMSRFGNAFLLRVRNEIRKLRSSNLWDRNVNRSPLACYLLQEMFKE